MSQPSQRSDFAEPRCGLGYILAEEKRYDEATEDYEYAYDSCRAADTRNTMESAFQVGRTNEAIEQFAKQSGLSPKDAIGHYNLGYSLFAAGILMARRRVSCCD
jgi:tetratricopeptide (TPR) repeat protein